MKRGRGDCRTAMKRQSLETGKRPAANDIFRIRRLPCTTRLRSVQTKRPVAPGAVLESQADLADVRVCRAQVWQNRVEDPRLHPRRMPDDRPQGGEARRPAGDAIAEARDPVACAEGEPRLQLLKPRPITQEADGRQGRVAVGEKVVPRREVDVKRLEPRKEGEWSGSEFERILSWRYDLFVLGFEA
jgi:hypothetical protein